MLTTVGHGKQCNLFCSLVRLPRQQSLPLIRNEVEKIFFNYLHNSHQKNLPRYQEASVVTERVLFPVLLKSLPFSESYL